MIKHHYDLIQCTEEWYAARCGLLTASEMDNIITPAKMTSADNKTSRNHLMEICAQRLTKYVEPTYISSDMLRGKDDEIDAKTAYEKANKIQVQDCGFITNDKFGFTLGYSPDGLVGEDGLIEVKSRCQKYQLETILSGLMPPEFMIQIQTGMLVSERSWCDFISYCGGMQMLTLRIPADHVVQAAIIGCASVFHGNLESLMSLYGKKIADPSVRLVSTERRPPEQEMHL